MAKVSLRIYNREIENLIDQGHTNEAIAHCRHILQTFPKHLETYRMLGKAYLEARRYGEAIEIFNRLLMAVPDDFVAHVGLSIIRDEEKKLDDAIWHMERAFEVQSSNPAIQAELQKLYGRRDGMVPPKVRMTRGALARIYVLGELYPQAISEIRSVLAEDPQRVDMQVLLAHSYYKSGQRADATDICNQLLKRYAYFFDANRIMVELITASAAAETTQVYRARIAELDPYSNFVKGSIFQTNEVPDASINLERLEYSSEEAVAEQNWNSSSLGYVAVPALGGDSQNDQHPEWLSSNMDEAPQPSNGLDSQPQAEAGIPDFLREAGWGNATQPEQPTSMFSDEAAGDIVQADIPDWLKNQEPSPSASTNAEATPAIETPDYLANLDSSFDPFSDVSAPNETPDWLKSASDETPIGTSASQDDVPNWMSGLDDSSQANFSTESKADVPDWLKGLDGDTSATTNEASGVTGWLEAQEQNTTGSSDTPDWLSGLGGVAGVQEDRSSADIPDWLQSSETKNTQPAETQNLETLGASAQEQDDAVAWLESLAAKHGAKPEELVTDPNKRNEKPPEWVEQAQNIGAQTPAPSVESLGASAQEQDDAVAWLESLAAKHGAKPEELVTDPNKRNEKPPEWVEQAQSIGAQTPAPSVESLGASAQEQDDAVAWLESLAAKHGAKPEELVTDPNKRNEKPPEWVTQAQNIGTQPPAESEPKKEWSENAASVGEEFFAEFEKASTSEPQIDETGMWLKNLDGSEEKPDQQEDIPDWMKPGAEEELPLERGSIPEWLSETESDENGKRPEGSLNTSSLPDWLDGLDETGEKEEPAYSSEEALVQNQDLSAWLSGLDDEPGLDIDPATLRAPLPPYAVPPQAEMSQPQKSDNLSDLPEWIQAVEPGKPAEDDEWQPPTASPEVEPLQTPPTFDTAPQNDDLPSWLQSADGDDEDNVPAEEDETPPWIHREQWEAGAIATPVTPPKPTSPSDWQPVQQKAVQSNQVPPPSPKSAEKKAPAKQTASKPVRKPEPQGHTAVLNIANAELERGDIPEALLHYGKLIKKGKHLEEVIKGLSESLYRYPVEVGIWQALGDAYMRANRLKEALDAYNKAEELIR
ncbi:MAG: tetratricopeptide repeat protein [Anaerolineales bacterium]|nr:tetratricopeptide repeat protein [Anaerolineales bacterium]